MADPFRIRPAVPGDEPTIVGFIDELAAYEKLSHESHPDPAALREHLFGERPVCEAFLCERDLGSESGVEPIGFALFFTSYSTFETKPCLYLEDLYVQERARGLGAGKALLQTLAREAVRRGCPRLDWAVLDWNKPAIGFYEKLGARLMNDWKTCRLEGEALNQLGS